MIWFNNLDVMLSCSYHVQKMYSTNSGTHSLSIRMDGANVTGQKGLYASAVKDEEKKQYIVKVVNLADQAQEICLQFKGLSRKETLDCPVTCTVLHSDDPYAENTLENPNAIVPVTSVIEPSSWCKNKLTGTIGPRTFAVYTISY
jgi:alpha-L-arabinofuranosidase